MEGPYLMGIDFGTGGARVGIFDREGVAVIFQATEWETEFPRSGWAEQNPDDWWKCLVTSTTKALEESGVSPEEIVGISVDTTGSTVVALDEQGKHLRPAIMWMDLRAAEQAQRISDSNDPALKYSGHAAVSAEWGLPKVLWLKEKDPDTFNNAAHICDCADWLTNRLTGEWSASINIVSTKYFYDRDAGGWPESLCETLEAPDLLEKLPQNVLDMGEVVGGLSKKAANELGLKADTPVAQGGIDGFMGALGLGVVEPGKMAFVTGSSHSMFGQAAEPLYAQGFFGAFTDAQIRGQYTIEAGQASTGSVVAWFKNRLAKGASEAARERDVDPYEVLDELAREVPRGSDGLIMLDYFQGNRTPYTDSLARGMFWGLSLGHGEGHIFRSILEGICYGTEHILRTMRENDFEAREIVVSGGPTKSELWMQMHADISNVPISLTKETEAPVLGSAMLAAVGAGIYNDIPEAAEKMVHTERTIEPDEEAHEEYKFYADRYIETYPAMRDLMQKTTQHVAAQGNDAE